jgi:hypothetical protein
MPFILHPSGYCVYYHDASSKNLMPGSPCIFCGKVAGHKPTCSLFVEKQDENKSSRVKLFDRAAMLYWKSFCTNSDLKFFTFTLPSAAGKKTYQESVSCSVTGDLAVTEKFSKLLENTAINIKRHRKGEKFSYVWVSEAQTKRQEKFGGVGDLHFHLLTTNYVPIELIRAHWNDLLGTNSKSCVDLDIIPKDVRTLPNYLAKYMGKGSQRRILSRRFSCTRDLSSFAPIKFRYLPPGMQPEKEVHFTTPSGYEVNTYYYNTYQTLDMWVDYMYEQKQTEHDDTNDPNFSESDISMRTQKRAHKAKSKVLSPLF